MRYSGLQIVFQEIPSEISLAIHITGCPLACKGCHSADLWNESIGTEITPSLLNSLIEKYDPYISCVLFMGGEWHPSELLSLIQIVKTKKKKCALYTGLQLEMVPDNLKLNLDYLKYGPYQAELGGLQSIKTNQVLINLKKNEQIFMHTKENQDDSSLKRTNK